MTELRYGPGDVIFREGDSSGYVCLVSEGTVEVAKAVAGGEVVLGTVGAGEFVGEMGVIEQRPRGATVRARTDVALQLLSEEEFMRRISEDPETSLLTLRRLSERLRAADDRLAEAGGDADGAEEEGGAAPSAPATLRIASGSAEVARALPDGEANVVVLPYHVGRPTEPGEPAPSTPLSLSVPDRMPYRLSRFHFSIVENPGDGGYAVRDVRSTLGTRVNGEFIGELAPRSVAALRPGENEVVAGGRDSPYVFKVFVPGS